MKHKNIKFGRSRSKDLLGPVIVQYLKAQPYRNAISNSRRTSNQLETRMTHLNHTENFDTMLKRTAERDDAEEEMERVEAELATMKTRRQAAKRVGENGLRMNSKHIRLTEEVK